MKKLVTLLAIALTLSTTGFSQTGSLEEVLDWLENECAQDTTGLAEYCDLLELAIACGEGDLLACDELEAGVEELLSNGGGDDDDGDDDDGDEFGNWLSSTLLCDEEELSQWKFEVFGVLPPAHNSAYSDEERIEFSCQLPLRNENQWQGSMQTIQLSGTWPIMALD